MDYVNDMRVIKMSKNGNNSEDMPGSKYFKIYQQPTGGIRFDVEMSESIETDIIEYSDLFNLLRTVHPNDEVHVHLSNFGGCCHTGFRLCQAFKSCAAPVIMYVEGNCYSMGSVLALSGKILLMSKYAFLHFHNYSQVIGGKASEVTSEITEYNKHFKDILVYLCSPFLTKKEIGLILKDEDVYIRGIDGETLVNRIKRHFPQQTYTGLLK